jgi:TonB dependent receptor/Carboxypeptidase regulatory-like domain/TonB-dependent Receptor Plug Domain
VQIRRMRCAARSALKIMIGVLSVLAGSAFELRAQSGTPPVTTTRTSTARLSGQVVDAVTGQPVAAAHVTIAGVPFRATTSLQGRFTIPAIPPGRYRVEVRRLGYKVFTRDDVVVDVAVDVAVGATEAAPLTIALAPAAYQLATQTVSPGSFSFADAPAQVPQTLTRTDIQSAPFGEDLFRAMNRLPGLSSGDYGAQFSIRGGRQDETLIQLDGLDIHEPFHLKDFNEGALSIFNVDAIDGVELLTGGFSAHYGDRRSGVMRITSRTPRAEGGSVTAGASLTGASILGEGRIAGDRGSWIVSGRSGFAGLLLRVINKSETRAPTYKDLFASARYALRPNHTLSLNLLHARDGYRFDIRGTTGFNDTIRTTERADNRYGNSYAWLSLQSLAGPYVHVRTIAAAGTVTAERAGDERRVDSDLSLYDVAGSRNFTELTLKQDYSLERSARALVDWGFDVRRLHAHYDWLNRVSQNPDNPTPDTTGFYPKVTQRSKATLGSTMGAYVSTRLRAADPLTLELGLRYDAASYSGDHDVSPRVHGLFRLSDRSTLRAGWGVYRQRQGIADENAFTDRSRYFRSELSRQWSVSVDHRFARGGSVRVEGYTKSGAQLRPIQRNWKSGLNVFPESSEDRILVYPLSSNGRGGELYLERPFGSRVQVRGGYAFAIANETVSRIDQINDPLKPPFAATHPNPQDQRHALNLDVSTRISGNWTVTGALTMHSGWPYTSESGVPITRRNGTLDLVVRPDTLYGARLPLYQRVDVRVTRRRRTASGELRLFAEVINLANHENVLGYDVFRERDASGRLHVVSNAETWFSIVPSIGVSWTRRF